MKNFVAFLCLMALCAVALGYPQQTSTTVRPTRRVTTRMSGHPNNDLIRKGLIDKLCTQKYKPSTTPKSATAPARRTRQAASGAKPQTTPTFGPTCSDFDDLSFEDLINRVKGGLRPVSRRP